MSSKSGSDNYPENVEIAVVGAGLVGSLAAIYMAKRGFEVDVFERRPDMRNEEIEAGRSINLNISCRGIEALKRVGIQENIMREVIPMKGRMMHSREGTLTYQPYGKDDSEFGNSISRAGLNKLLMSEAEATGKVRFHFNVKAIFADFDSKLLCVLKDECAWDPFVVIQNSIASNLKGLSASNLSLSGSRTP